MMNQTTGILIMMNNYFHDVATALLLAGGYVIWVIVKRYDASAKTRETTEYFLSIYGKAVKLAKIALIWIVLGGIPRTIFYAEFEWANAAGKGQIAALIVKHILAFAFVGTGAHIWIRVNKKVKQIRQNR
jgi:hypothetical protein